MYSVQAVCIVLSMEYGVYGSDSNPRELGRTIESPKRLIWSILTRENNNTTNNINHNHHQSKLKIKLQSQLVSIQDKFDILSYEAIRVWYEKYLPVPSVWKYRYRYRYILHAANHRSDQVPVPVPVPVARTPLPPSTNANVAAQQPFAYHDFCSPTTGWLNHTWESRRLHRACLTGSSSFFLLFFLCFT